MVDMGVWRYCGYLQSNLPASSHTWNLVCCQHCSNRYRSGIYIHGTMEEAIEFFKQAIRIKPDYADAHNNLGLAYLGLNDRGSALEQYKILKKLDTEQANKLFNFIYSE